MSGGLSEPEEEISKLIRQLMEQLNIDEETARKVISWCNNYSIQKMNKWIRNIRKRRKRNRG
jgi:hypothetical protein